MCVHLVKKIYTLGTEKRILEITNYTITHSKAMEFSHFELLIPNYSILPWPFTAGIHY